MEQTTSETAPLIKTASSSSSSGAHALLTPPLSSARQQAIHHVAEQYRQSSSRRAVVAANASTTSTGNRSKSDDKERTTAAALDGRDDDTRVNKLDADQLSVEDEQPADDSTRDEPVRSPATASSSGASPISAAKMSKLEKGAAPMSSKRRAALQRKAAEEAAQAEKADIRRAVERARAQERQGSNGTPSQGAGSVTESISPTTTPTPAAATPTTATAAADGGGSSSTTTHHNNNNTNTTSGGGSLPFMPGLVDEYRQRQHTQADNYGAEYGYAPQGGGYEEFNTMPPMMPQYGSGAGQKYPAPYADAYHGNSSGSGMDPSYMPPRNYNHNNNQNHNFTTHTFGGMQRRLQQQTAPMSPHATTSIPQLPPQLPPPPPQPAVASGARRGRPVLVHVPDGPSPSQGHSATASPMLPPPPSYTEAAMALSGPPSVPPPPPYGVVAHPPRSPFAGAPHSPMGSVGSPFTNTAVSFETATGSDGAGLSVPPPPPPPPPQQQQHHATVDMAPAYRGAPPAFTTASGQPHLSSSSAPLPDPHVFSTAASSVRTDSAVLCDDDDGAEDHVKVDATEKNKDEAALSSPPLPHTRREAYTTAPSPLLASMRLAQPWTISCTQGSHSADSEQEKDDAKGIVSMESEYVLQLLPTWSMLTSGLIYDSPDLTDTQPPASQTTGTTGHTHSRARLRRDGVLGVFPAHLSEVMAAEQVLATGSAVSGPTSPLKETSPGSSLPSTPTSSVTTAPRYYCVEVELDLMVRPTQTASSPSPPSSPSSPASSATPTATQAGSERSRSLVALQRSQRLLKALRRLGGSGAESGCIAADDLAAMLNDAMLTVVRVAPHFDSLCDALVLASMAAPAGQTPVLTAASSGASAHGANTALTRELLDVLGVSATGAAGGISGGNGSCTSSTSCAVTPSARELNAVLAAGGGAEDGPAEGNNALHFQIDLPQHVPFVSADGVATAAATAAAAAAGSTPTARRASGRPLLASLVGAPGSSPTAAGARPIGLQVEVVRAEPCADTNTTNSSAQEEARVTLLLSIAVRDPRPALASTAATAGSVDASDVFASLTTILPAPLVFSARTRRVSTRSFGAPQGSKAGADTTEDAQLGDGQQVPAAVVAEWVRTVWGETDTADATATDSTKHVSRVASRDVDEVPVPEASHQPNPEPDTDNAPDDKADTPEIEEDEKEQREETKDTVREDEVDNSAALEATASGDDAAPQDREYPVESEVEDGSASLRAASTCVFKEAAPEEPSTEEAPVSQDTDKAEAQPEEAVTTPPTPPTPPEVTCEVEATHEIHVNTMAAPLADLLHKLYGALRDCRRAAVEATRARGFAPLETVSAGGAGSTAAAEAEVEAEPLTLAARSRYAVPSALLHTLQAGRGGSAGKRQASLSGGGGRHKQKPKGSPQPAGTGAGSAATEQPDEQQMEAVLSHAFAAAAVASDASLCAELSARSKAQQKRSGDGDDKISRDACETSEAAVRARWAEATNPNASLLRWLEAHALAILSDMEATLTHEAVRVETTSLPPNMSASNAASAAASSAKRGPRRGGANAGVDVSAQAVAAAADRTMNADVAAETSQSALHPLRYLYELLAFAEQDPLTLGVPARTASAEAIPSPPSAAAFANSYRLLFRPGGEGEAEGRVRCALRHAATQLQSLISELQNLSTALSASAPSTLMWESVTVPYLDAVAETMVAEQEARDQLWAAAQRSRRTVQQHEQQKQQQQLEQEQEEEQAAQLRDDDADESDNDNEVEGEAEDRTETPNAREADEAFGSAADSPAPVVAPLHLASRHGTTHAAEGEDQDGLAESATPESTPRNTPSSLASSRRPKPSTPRAGGSKKNRKSSSTANVAPTATSSFASGPRNTSQIKPRSAPSPSSSKAEKPERKKAAMDVRVKHSELAALRHLLLPFLGVAVLTILFLYFA